MVKEIPSRPLPVVKAFADQARDNLLMAHDAIIVARAHQSHPANKRQRDEQVVHGSIDPIKEGDLLYLSTTDLNLPKGRAKKLLPRFIGPYKVLRAHPETSNYTLDLPEDLRRRKVHATFHISWLCRHEASDDALFPHRDTQVFYDLGTPNETEWLVDEITAHRWEGRKLRFLVRWNVGDSTWEPLENCQDLEAFDNYLDTQGVRTPTKLPRAPTTAST